MILQCREDIYAIGFESSRLFTGGQYYEFVSIDNRYTKINGYIGYVKKDDEGHKRWVTGEFIKFTFEKQ